MKNVRKFIILPTMLVSVAVLSSSKFSETDTNSYTDNDVIRLNDGATTATSADYCLLTFDANSTDGGSWKGLSGTPTFQVRKGHNWARIKNKKGIPNEENLKNSSPSKEYKGWVDSNNKHISDYYTFNDDTVTFKAKWGEVYTPSTFATDSWDVIIQAADKGYSELTSKYESAYKYKNYNTFIIKDIGDTDEVKLKTRYVTINGYNNPLRDDGKWPVRVIGENHDLIYGTSGAVAPLTFEFEYALYPSIGYDYTQNKGHQSWDKSSLKKYLNTYLYYQFEDALKNGIQYVSKNTDNGYGIGEIESSKDILFVPSVSEMSKDLDTEKYTNLENSLYGFYDIHHESSEVIKRNPFKLDAEGNPVAISTWVRSPNLNRGKNNCKAYKTSASSNVLSSNGDVSFELSNTNSTAGIAPCFAIGEENRVQYNFTGEGLSFTSLNGYADTTSGFKGKVVVSDDSKYDLPTTIKKITFTPNNGVAKELTGSDYTYNDGTGLLDIKKEAITSNEGKLEIFASPNDNKFKTDTWDNLIANADQGLDKLKEVYGYENYVGKYKYININNKSYKCRVIGQGEDTLSDGTGKALLTFQLETALDGDTISFSDTDATNYTTSNLNNYLQEQLKYLPSGLKKVNKIIDTKKNSNSPFGASTFSTKIFALSFSEMNLNSSHPVDNEGESYSYYKDVSTYSPDKLKYLDNKKYEEVSYWLRSPATVNVADYVNIDGEIKQNIACTEKSNYIIPAFCIGQQKVEHKVTFEGDNYTCSDPTYQKEMSLYCGYQFKVTGIKAQTNYKIDTDSISVKTASNQKFNDYVFKLDEATNSYTLSIMKAPDEDLIVSIVPSGCFKISLMEDSPSDSSIDIGFRKSTSISDISFQYSTDGANFLDYTFGNSLKLSLSSGENMSKQYYFRATDTNAQISGAPINSPSDSNSNTQFISKNATNSPKIALSGNIMTLFDKTGQETEFKNIGGICQLFRNDNASGNYIYDASGLILGGTSYSSTLSAGDMWFYDQVFYNCTQLIKGPKSLDFTITNNSCSVYKEMFCKCTSLEETPLINVDKLTDYCFHYTFNGCTNLKSASDLNVNGAYGVVRTYLGMFENCSELVKGPSKIGSYDAGIQTTNETCGYMFKNCVKLETCPIIDFYGTNNTTSGCSSFTECFLNCAFKSAVINVKQTAAPYIAGYQQFTKIFKGCNNLNAVYWNNLDTFRNDYWREVWFREWLNVTAPEEYGTHYVYLKTLAAKYLYAQTESSGHAVYTIPVNWGIRNIETGEELTHA